MFLNTLWVTHFFGQIRQVYSNFSSKLKPSLSLMQNLDRLELARKFNGKCSCDLIVFSRVSDRREVFGVFCKWLAGLEEYLFLVNVYDQICRHVK